MIQAVILASDETHLTNFSGSKVFHALYMTLGNIHGPIRRQPQSGAWLLLAILPSCSFTKTLLNLTSPQSHIILNKTEAASLPGILKQHLYHESMAIVIAPLCPAQRRSHLVQGPGNKVHSSMPCLLGYIANMKEQFMIACVTPKACPVCLAQPRLDDSTIQDHSTAKLHTGNSTLSVLHRVRKAHPNVPILKFRTLVSKEKCGVSGYVEHPFWEGLDVGPSLFIYQDLLHGAHKFFWDHPCKWIASLIGTQCLDRRISLLPKEGLHHFKSGISKLKQASGREHRDLLKYIAPALAGAPGVTSPSRDLILALLHIIMIIQLPMLDDDILGELDKHFEVMYANADEAISLGLKKISGFPSLWPSPIFVKILSWAVSQAIGVLKPQKLSTNYSPNHSLLRPTTRTITSPCLGCLQSMRQRGLDINISSGDLPSSPPNSQTHPCQIIVPRIMASRLLRGHIN